MDRAARRCNGVVNDWSKSFSMVDRLPASRSLLTVRFMISRLKFQYHEAAGLRSGNFRNCIPIRSTLSWKINRSELLGKVRVGVSRRSICFGETANGILFPASEIRRGKRSIGPKPVIGKLPRKRGERGDSVFRFTPIQCPLLGDFDCFQNCLDQGGESSFHQMVIADWSTEPRSRNEPVTRSKSPSPSRSINSSVACIALPVSRA